MSPLRLTFTALSLLTLSACTQASPGSGATASMPSTSSWTPSQIQEMKDKEMHDEASKMGKTSWTPEEEKMMREKEAEEQKMGLKTPEAMTEPNGGAAMQDVLMHSTGGVTYENYTLQRYKDLLGKKPMVLYFHANWCPICKQLDSLLREQGQTLTGGVPILKIDYDTEKELKSTYDIRIQHTFIAIGKDGKVRKVVIGPNSLPAIQAIIDAANA